MDKVLITDVTTSLLQEGLRDLGFKVVNMPDVDQEYVDNHIHEFQGVIVRSKITMFEPTLKRASNLKFIGRPGSGLDLIDLDYCKSAMIAVCRSATSNSNAVAEHALGMLLAWSNNMIRANIEVKKFIWRREANRGYELMGKTVGIIGFGNTGSRFAKKLQGMEVKVLAYDKYISQYASDFEHVTESTIEEICHKADILSFHLPLNNETHHYLDAELIAAMKKPFLLINTSRGPIVDTKALIDGLNDGKVIGACLDVLENEEPSEYTDNERNMYENLFHMNQVLLTPHIAGWSDKSKIQMESYLLDEIRENVLQ